MTDIFKFFTDIQPIITFIGTLFSITALGFIIKLNSLSQSAKTQQINAIKEQKRIIEEQKRIIEERLKNSVADLARTEKWHEKEKSELQHKLSTLMNQENISLEKFFS